MADAKKMTPTKMWIIGLVALVVLLGAMSLMQRNKIKKLAEAAKANSTTTNSGTGDGMDAIVQSSTIAETDKLPTTTETTSS